MNKSGRIHACPQRKKVDRTKKQKKQKKDECRSMNKSGWTTKKKKKKIDDKVTLSHVGKSTIQSRQTKYHKNGMLIDYNAS